MLVELLLKCIVVIFEIHVGAFREFYGALHPLDVGLVFIILLGYIPSEILESFFQPVSLHGLLNIFSPLLLNVSHFHNFPMLPNVCIVNEIK